jgi:hypothetical protein
MPRKQTSVSPDRSASATTLRIYDPGSGSYPVPGHDAARVWCGGIWRSIRYWTPLQWAKLAEQDQPTNVVVGDSGGYFGFGRPD